MTERSIAPRPSLEQVVAIVNFMEQHPDLGMGQMRGLDGRHKSKKLWMKITRIVNNLQGPTRPMKSWVKYWADKKSTVRSKVMSSGGNPNILFSNIEKKIWDLFLAHDTGNNKSRTFVKIESHYPEDNNVCNEDSVEENHIEDTALSFEEQTVEPVDIEERNMLLMEKLVKVMSDQASAVSQLAHASQVSAQAMERLAEASHIQSRAIERLAGTFETISSSAHHISASIVDIDTTMKRFYNTAPT